MTVDCLCTEEAIMAGCLIHDARARAVSPDCRDGNCGKCDGVAWDLVADAPTSCSCSRCHHDR